MGGQYLINLWGYRTPFFSIPNFFPPKNDFFKKIKCLEKPKMQNKHQKILMWGDQPPGREEGVKPVGQNDQVLQKRVFYGTPFQLPTSRHIRTLLTRIFLASQPSWPHGKQQQFYLSWNKHGLAHLPSHCRTRHLLWAWGCWRLPTCFG